MIVSMSASVCFKLGFRERLKRMERERFCVLGEEDLERRRKVEMAPSVCARRLRLGGLTLVMEDRVWRAFR